MRASTMKLSRIATVSLLLAATAPRAPAQPSFEGPPPSRVVVEDPVERRAQYLGRVDEVLDWVSGRVNFEDPATVSMAAIAIKLARGEDVEACSSRVIELMKEPGTGPFWMFPVVCVSFAGRDQLSPEARAAIRDTWRTTRQLRGDTENHFAMYYTSLYLMSELYPNEPGGAWYTGLSSEENLAESRAYLIDWMDITTTIGQGEYNPSHYIGEYAIPMLFLATWAKDLEMRQRGHMMLDWLFAELAANTLDGVLRGANSRTDDISVLERWNALASFFSWVLFGNTPPTAGYGGWGTYFAVVAKQYEVPEVIYRIAMDREGDFTQRDLGRTRRRWRYSDELSPPIHKTSYMREDYAVGSYQGGLSDPIQTHVWDVTWSVPDPRGVNNTIFSLHPHSSSVAMQMHFSTYPEPMIKGVEREGKPSYDQPDKILGCSPYEQVVQDLDTIIALYDIPEGERFPHINGFFSKDLANLTEDGSGWIFAQGGDAYIAYRPLAGYTWKPYQKYVSMWAGGERADLGDRILQSPHLKNGTIVQAASASEFGSFEAFQAAIRALPLEFTLAPTPTVKFTSLRGKRIVATYGKAPVVDGRAIDYRKWKLFEGPYLDAEKGSKKLTITHGRLERILDFNTLAISERVKPRP